MRRVQERRRSVTDKAIDKHLRVEELSDERQRAHEARRVVHAEQRRVVELVKQEVEKQSIANKYSPEKIQQQVEQLLRSSSAKFQALEAEVSSPRSGGPAASPARSSPVRSCTSTIGSRRPRTSHASSMSSLGLGSAAGRGKSPQKGGGGASPPPRVAASPPSKAGSSPRLSR